MPDIPRNLMSGQVTTRLGRVSLNPRGSYDAEQTYGRLDLVEYNGSGYVCLQESVKGQTPESGENWMRLADNGGAATVAAAQEYANQAKASQDEAKKSETAAQTAQTQAESAKTDAETARDAAASSAETATQQASAAESSATAASGSADAASASETAAQTAQTQAEAAQDAAKGYQDAAGTSATAAAASAEEASGSATAAEGSATEAAESAEAASASKTAAASSAEAAESAKDTAVTAGAAATESAEQAAASAETAKQYSGNPPQIGEDGTWETWDAASGAYTDTNKPSRGVQGEQGEPGVSPTVSTNKVGKTTTVTITDAEGPHQFEIQDGLDGTGAGDMAKSTYDTEGRDTDIFKYVDDAVKNVQITTDDDVTAESQNPVKSSGIYKALQNVKIELDTEPTMGSEKAVQSGGVYTALQSKADLGEDNKVLPAQLPEHLIVGEAPALPGVLVKQDADTLEHHSSDYFAVKEDTQQALADMTEKYTALKAQYDELEKLPHSGRNLLDNADFRNPINQRGEMEYTGNRYGIDRWLGFGENFTVNVNGEENCIILKAGSGVSGLFQKIDMVVEEDTTVTFSVLYKGKIILTYYVDVKNVSTPSEDWGIASLTYTIPAGTDLKINVYNPFIQILSNEECSIKAAKLELGAVQTLAHQDADGNWVLNDPPPDYTTELLKCQRYYLAAPGTSYLIGASYSASFIYVNVPSPVYMRVRPTIEVKQLGELHCDEQSIHFSANNLSVYRYDTGTILLCVGGISTTAKRLAVIINARYAFSSDL